MRSAILELNKRDYVGIYFDQVGEKALADGHIREALQSDRELIAKYPNDALHHSHYARALLEAGIGAEAHLEARRATDLDPKSAIAFSTLGWTLTHNDLGDRYGLGFDLSAALAAYKQSLVLDPENSDTRFDYAILNEYDRQGNRYTQDANLPVAIQQYRDLIERKKAKNEDSSQDKENLLFALLYAHQYSELDKMLATLPSSDSHAAFAIASATEDAEKVVVLKGRDFSPAVTTILSMRL
jgi:tetratricopeptide (TPR) repeat protein